MRGLALVYNYQLMLLESKFIPCSTFAEDSKGLLSILNGDQLWSVI